jgi:hypothetical protein
MDMNPAAPAPRRTTNWGAVIVPLVILIALGVGVAANPACANCSAMRFTGSIRARWR